jgi:hypothetical protein
MHRLRIVHLETLSVVYSNESTLPDLFARGSQAGYEMPSYSTLTKSLENKGYFVSEIRGVNGRDNGVLYLYIVQPLPTPTDMA